MRPTIVLAPARAPRAAVWRPVACAAACAGACTAGALLAPAPAAAQLQPADPTFWSAAALALAGTAAGDGWLRRELRGPGAPATQSLARAVEPLGRARTAVVGLGGSFLAAEFTGQHAWARATVRVAAGYVAADAITSILKPLVGRARPFAEQGAYHFHAFATTDREHAFASGHATHAFALAAGVAGEARRPWVTAVAYGTAALVGWSRVHDDAHWTSDVVAGAIVGTSASLTTNHWLARRVRRRPTPADTLGATGHGSGGDAVRITLLPRGAALALSF